MILLALRGLVQTSHISILMPRCAECLAITSNACLRLIKHPQSMCEGMAWMACANSVCCTPCCAIRVNTPSHGLIQSMLELPRFSRSHLAQVTSHVGADSLSAALYGCHLVIIPAGVPRKPGMTRDDLFNINAGQSTLMP